MAAYGPASGAGEPSTTDQPSSIPIPILNPIEKQIVAIIAQIDLADPDTYGAPEEIVDMSRAAVPVMLDLLDSPDLPTRYAAVYVLSRLAQPEDIPEMVKGLEDPNLSNRATIAATLLWLGDERGIPALEEAARSEEVLAFSHPPILLADYARRVLDQSPLEIPALPEPGPAGRGFLSSPFQAPLRDVEVNLTDCTINIVVNLQFTGDGATEELASAWAEAITAMWDGKSSSGCCKTSVTVNTKVAGDPDPEYGQVNVKQMPHAGAHHTSNMTLGGTVGEGGVANDIEGGMG